MKEIDAIAFLLSRGYKIEPEGRAMKRKIIKVTIHQLMTGLGRLPKQREIAAALRVSQPATVAHWWIGGKESIRSGETSYSEVWQEIFDSVDAGEEYKLFKADRKKWLLNPYEKAAKDL